jgi:PrcB C-terminal
LEERAGSAVLEFQQTFHTLRKRLKNRVPLARLTGTSLLAATLGVHATAEARLISEKHFSAQMAAAQSKSRAEKALAFQTVAKGFRSGIREPLQTVARNDAEWRTLWQKQVAAQSNPPPPPAIDFKNELVAAVFLGEKPTGGYSIEIVGAEKTNGSLTISYSETVPRPGSMLTQAFTQPFHIVRVITTDTENVAFRRLP